MKLSCPLIVLSCLVFGGCSQQPASNEDKVRELESKVTALQAKLATLELKPSHYILYPAYEEVPTSFEANAPTRTKPVIYRLDTVSGSVARLEKAQMANGKNTAIAEGWQLLSEENPLEQVMKMTGTPYPAVAKQIP